MAGKHLADEGIINYKTDIEPYPFVAIYAGVGSGKTTYFEKLAKGEIAGVPAKTILLITSRRAKVNETRADKSLPQDTSIGQHDHFYYLCEDEEELDSILNSSRVVNDPNGWGGDCTIRQRFVTCTNAAIEKYLESKYAELDVTTHLWNRFDLIVLDEAHSARADASYQSAPYYVQRLINEVCKKNLAEETTCKAVIMTGTPRIISDYSLPKKSNVLDLRESCISVVPRKICFVTKEQAAEKMCSMLQANQRGIYFYNHVKELMQSYKEIQRNAPALAEHIAVSYTKEKARQELAATDSTTYQRTVNTERAIAETSRIPQNITMLFSTEKNKEGINIENEDIKVMFVESHIEATVVQMAGRVRNGLDVLYVVTNSRPHSNKESTYEWGLTSREDFLDSINKDLLGVFKRSEYDRDLYRPVTTYPQIKAYIKFIHDKFPYLRYDYFDNKFVLYTQRKGSISYYSAQNEKFDGTKKSVLQLYPIAKEWFPTSEVSDEILHIAEVDAYIEENKLVGREVSTEELAALKAYIIAFPHKSHKENAQEATLLKHYGYKLCRGDSHHKGNAVTITKEK